MDGFVYTPGPWVSLQAEMLIIGVYFQTNRIYANK